ncbi:hypothetical protein IEQ34_003285 [Dendrobium chrysotoxum]|uniref:Uncharacterized protein n=1 Tax=Dendrobium chrysotoxum TaxID=161865 RepID=A0AAV7HH86_DENCH|nr:hypothetical protein IEQ34_003285 [Dendrobium chrysotoxum]
MRLSLFALARYAPHLIPTTKEKCDRFLQGLHRLIEIDLAVLTSRHDESSRYNVNRRRSTDEISKDRDRDNDKKSHYSDLRASGSIASTDGYDECIHYVRLRDRPVENLKLLLLPPEAGKELRFNADDRLPRATTELRMKKEDDD